MKLLTEEIISQFEAHPIGSTLEKMQQSEKLGCCIFYVGTR